MDLLICGAEKWRYLNNLEPLRAGTNRLRYPTEILTFLVVDFARTKADIHTRPMGNPGRSSPFIWLMNDVSHQTCAYTVGVNASLQARRYSTEEMSTQTQNVTP